MGASLLATLRVPVASKLAPTALQSSRLLSIKHPMSALHPAPVPRAAPLPAARAFGLEPADLSIDFDQPDRTALATAVLAHCCADTSVSLSIRENAAWDLPISARIARLLRILKLTTDSDTLTLIAPCPHAGCGRRLELDLPYAELESESSKTNSGGNIVQFPVPNSAQPIALRLPTGRDQITWRTQSFADAGDALANIVRSLAVEPAALPPLTPEHLEPLGAALEATDPLVAFKVHTTCPYCERPADLEIDLDAAALRQLADIRRAVLRDIHELARHYGWTEAEVLAIPPRRRAEYKRLIAAAEEASP